MSKVISSSQLTETPPATIQPTLSKAVWFRGKWVWYILTLIPPAILLIELAHYTLPTPLLDEWLFVPLVIKLHTGGLTLGDLWQQNNEHRIFIWKLLALALAKVVGYEASSETLAGFVTAVLTWLVAWRLLRLSLPDSWQGPAMFISSWFIFSLCQWLNWIWGLEWCWFIINLLGLLAILMLSYRPVNTRNFAIAVGLAFVATYTVGSGLLLWPAVLLGMLLDWRNWGWKYSLSWLAASLVSYGLYLINYNPQPVVPLAPKTYALHHITDTIIFSLNYLGSPIANWGFETQGALWFALVMLILVSTCGSWLWWQTWRQTQDQSSWVASWPGVVLVFFAIGNAVLTAISRVSTGPREALDSRYTTTAIWFWLGGGLVIATAFQTFYQKGRLTRVRKLVRNGAIIVGLATLISFGFTYYYGYQLYPYLVSYLYPVNLRDYRILTPELLQRPYYRTDIIYDMTTKLEDYQEGPFRLSTEQYKQQRLGLWQSFLSEEPFQAVVYPANLVEIISGSLLERNIGEEQFSFVHNGFEPVRLGYSLDRIYQQNGYIQGKTIPIEIEAQNTAYIRIYYDLGKGIMATNQFVSNPVQEKNGHRYFQGFLPSKTRQIQVETIYSTSQPTSEQLKITFYLLAKSKG